MSIITVTTDKHTILEVPFAQNSGKNLLDFLREHGLPVNAPCGGNGTCGKCLVTVTFADGTIKQVRACRSQITEPVRIDLAGALPEKADGITSDFFSGRLQRHENSAAPENPSASGNTSVSENSAASEEAPLRNAIFHQRRLGAACDLGTTTVEIRLFDLASGEEVGNAGAWNAQLPYGADVISRASYTMTHPEGLETLSLLIRKQIADLIRQQIADLIQSRLIELYPDFSDYSSDPSIRAAGPSADSHDSSAPFPRKLVVAGNTIMQHLFAGLDPSAITRAPFIPNTLFDEDKIWHFPEFGDTDITLLPCISGYVGGDITAGLLSTGLLSTGLLPSGLTYGTDVSSGLTPVPCMPSVSTTGGLLPSGLPGSAQRKASSSTARCTLFLDIGTNGEMALCFPDHLICCSAASGPAFEGASITCGMRSIPGAINHAVLSRGHLDLSVIGEKGQKPKGVCGSGLIDLVAILLDKKIVDESGRLKPPSEVSPRVRYFLTEDENENGIFWLDMAHTLSLRQEDIRQVQLAKAAIAAGIRRMMEEAHVTCEQIDRVLIAGGFGKHLNAEAVCRIGMIPAPLQDKIVGIGNSSLDGAGLLLLHAEMQSEFAALNGHCRYLELSTDSRFTDTFVESMMF